MSDVSPELKKEIIEVFEKKISKDELIKELRQLLADGKATTLQANYFGVQAGKLMSDALRTVLTEERLPNGKLYENIFKNAVLPSLKEGYNQVSTYTADTITLVCRKNDLAFNALSTRISKSRTDGLSKILNNAPSYVQTQKLLGEPVINLIQSGVTSTIKHNADKQAMMGLNPVIIRRADVDCCVWCQKLVGKYDYLSLPANIYRRHERCRCTVIYTPGNGIFQDVYSKKLLLAEREERIENIKSAEAQIKKEREEGKLLRKGLQNNQ